MWDLYTIQNHGFSVIIFLTWMLYIVIALGLSANAPEYLNDLQSYVKIYVSLFLIYRFNPFHRVRFNKLDARIAFSAGLFLLATTAINNFLLSYLDEIKDYLQYIKFT